MLRLGWRNPRPNDFQSNDERPLRDLFGNLQQFLTFPHVGVEMTGTFPSAFGNVTLTPISGAPFNANHDPYSLVRNNTIQVPQDFDSWLFVGAAGVLLQNVGAGRYIMGWRVNNVTLNPWIGQTDTPSPSGGISPRVVCPFIRPVEQGDFLSIGIGADPGSGNILDGEAWGIFLPLT